jgi:hypothetical protein
VIDCMIGGIVATTRIKEYDADVFPAGSVRIKE